MTPDAREAIDALYAKATPGEWSQRIDLGPPWTQDIYAGAPHVAITCEQGFKRVEDVAFVVALHNAWPALSSELSRLRAVERAAREYINAYRQERPDPHLLAVYRGGLDAALGGVGGKEGA